MNYGSPYTINRTLPSGLARIGPYKQHPAMAQPDMRDLDRDRHAVNQHDLVRPVELVGLAGRKAQWHISFGNRRAARGQPLPRVPPNRVIATGVSEPAQFLEDPGLASAARAPALPRYLTAAGQDRRATTPASAAAAPSACTQRRLLPNARTLRTVFRDTLSSRTISLIDLPLTKRSRLIRAIVSTTNIPPPPAPTPSGSACTSQRKGGQSWTPITPPPGSIFHAETHRSASPPTRQASSLSPKRSWLSLCRITGTRDGTDRRTISLRHAVAVGF